MADPIATPDDMAALLGYEVDPARAAALVDLAQEHCTTVIDPVPSNARAVVLAVAVRAYTNPTNAEQQTASIYSATYGPGGGGLYLSKQERATLLRLAGRGGAFSIDLMPAERPPLPWWDQSPGSFYEVETS